mgnify:CR=1 FL=1
MSSIRLSGTSSGYYDLTVPAAAGTNSIDLSKLPVKDSSGNLAITGALGINTTGTGVSGQFGTGITVRRAVPEVHLQRDDGNGNGGVLMDNNSSTRRMYVGTYDTNSETHIGTNGTQRLIINASGHVTVPNQPGMNAFATASNSGSYNASTNANQFCIWTGVRYNIGNHYNTSNGTFTCPVAGKYFVSFHANWHNSGAGSWLMIQVYRNSSIEEQWYNSTYGSWMNEAGSTVLNCAANDTIRLYKQTQSGAGGGSDLSLYSSFVVRLLG